jgi:hypothetical protein
VAKLRLLEGSNVADALLHETVPATPPIWKVLGVTLVQSSASLKLTVSEAFTGTLTVGPVLVTVGGVVSGAAAVVKVQELVPVRPLPARSLMPFAPVASVTG